MIKFSHEDINAMHHLYRINLINSCSGFKSANLIGTKSQSGISNVAVFSSVTHLGSDPAVLGFFLRPTTVLRNTYENILETRSYTINHIHQDIIEDAHHTSAKYDKHISEFDKTNLTEDYKPGIIVPFVKNAPVQIQMRYIEEYDIKINQTKLIVGQIENLYLNEDILHKDGFIELSKANVSAINGLDAYCTPKLKKRMTYQRPR